MLTCNTGSCRWNAARSFAHYLDMNPSLYEQRCVLELGAGGGLPGIVAAKNGAKKVRITKIRMGSHSCYQVFAANNDFR